MLPQYNQPSPLPREAAAQAAASSDEVQPTSLASSPPPSLRLSTPSDASYEYLHHILIGSPQGVNHAVHQLHLLHYVEKRLWTPLIAIGERGLTITQAEGQVLRYLVRQRPRGLPPSP